MSDPPQETVEREAADWFARLGASSVSADTLETFRSWRKRPAHADAYARVEALWSQAGRLSGDPGIDHSLKSALGRARPSPPGRRGRLRAAGLAATLVAAGVVGFSLWLDARSTRTTGVGELRLVALDDGSQVRLDTDTRVRVRYGRDERRLVLDRGQALFTVVSDRDRPFVVEAGGTTVRALGTRFDVRREAKSARVTLLSGSVAVVAVSPARKARWRLRPGEQVLTGSTDARARAVDVAAATSWIDGRLTFRSTPLAAAVAEVNRYSRRKIVLEAPTLAALPVNGVFNTGDADAFIAAAKDLFALDERRDADGTVRLVPRAPPA